MSYEIRRDGTLIHAIDSFAGTHRYRIGERFARNEAGQFARRFSRYFPN